MAKGYKITNKQNGLVYYGVVYGKSPCIYRRFQKHGQGQGGKFLYEHGIKVFGLSAFTIEEQINGALQDVREWEYEMSRNNLWPKGYNGSAGKIFIRTKEVEEKRLQKYKETIQTRDRSVIDRMIEKRNKTYSKKSKYEIEKTRKKLSNAAKRFWYDSPPEKIKQKLMKQGISKSKSYHQKTEEEKQKIRDKIRLAHCKKRYKTPLGIFKSTVEGGIAHNISSSLFNHRCKSIYYPEYQLLS